VEFTGVELAALIEKAATGSVEKTVAGPRVLERPRQIISSTT
jgi:hypothetical protein